MASSSTSKPDDSNNTKDPMFVTVIDPTKDNIMLPYEFYKAWQTELQLSAGPSIRLDDKEANVSLYLDGCKSHMFCGEGIAGKLGIEKRTRVLLEFKYPSCKFDVVEIEDSETEDDETEDDETEDDDSDKEERYQVYEPEEVEPEDDEIDNNEFYRLYEPLPCGLGCFDDINDLQYYVLEIWSKQVNVSMANLENEHKLMFSECISDLIPGDLYYIRLKSCDSDFEHDCKIGSTRINDGNGGYVVRKHISGAWNLYRKRHGLKHREMLHFKLSGPPFTLKVKIQRKREQPLHD